MQHPAPDTKDWSWVVDTRCPECGFEPGEIERDEIPDLIRDYAAVLGDAARHEASADRPAPTRWSPLEYACHTRDVCSLFVGRLHRMLTEDNPEFRNWDQDATAQQDQYWSQRPGLVVGALTAAADTMAESLAAVPDDQWQRTGRRADGANFTVATLAVYFLHDLAHHAWDVTGRLTSAYDAF